MFLIPLNVSSTSESSDIEVKRYSIYATTQVKVSFFQVSYVSVSTRETYSKVGRELLAAIATAHPHVISVLLERLRETIQTVGMVGTDNL